MKLTMMSKRPYQLLVLLLFMAEAFILCRGFIQIRVPILTIRRRQHQPPILLYNPQHQRATNVNTNARLSPLRVASQNPPSSFTNTTTASDESSTSDQDNIDTNESPSRRRNVNSLKEWALANGVQLGGQVQFEQNLQNQLWGVTRRPSSATPLQDSKLLMEIPASLVLSSTMIDDTLQDKVHNQLAQHGMEHYAPEFCLFLLVLRELSLGDTSPWYPWLQSLPTTHQTGLYWDDLEQQYAIKLGCGQYLEHQQWQWHAFSTSLKEIWPEASACFSPDTLRWAFSIVFTRCWRSSYTTKTTNTSNSGKQRAVAAMCPMADMFNHGAGGTIHIQQENVDANVKVHLKDNLDNNAGSANLPLLLLDYGYPEHPERFLVVFGFCDTSAPAIYANGIFDANEDDDSDKEVARKLGLYHSHQLVFYTDDGAISDTVWNAVLYKLLKWKLSQNDNDNTNQSTKEQLERDWKILASIKDSDEEMTEALVQVHLRHRQDVLDFLRYELEEKIAEKGPYGPVPTFGPRDYQRHPHLQMLVDYHSHMRSIYQKVLAN